MTTGETQNFHLDFPVQPLSWKHGRKTHPTKTVVFYIAHVGNSEAKMEKCFKSQFHPHCLMVRL